MQFMCFLKARSERAGAFRQWFLESLAPRLLEMAPMPVQRLIVNLADCPPAGFAIYGGAEVAVGPQYEVILQVWCESGADFERLLAVGEAELQEWVEVLHCYRITETEVLHKPDLLVGKPTPGYKLLRGLFFHEDMPDSAVQRSWERHQHLAVKVHVGLARYVRHWVDEVLTADAPAIPACRSCISPARRPCWNAISTRPVDRKKSCTTSGISSAAEPTGSLPGSMY